MDNVTLQIEELKLKVGTYREAFFEYMMINNLYDIDELYDSLDAILKDKFRYEIASGGNFRPGNPNYRPKSSLLDFI